MRGLFQPRRMIIGAAVLLMFVVSGCSGALPGESWPGVSTDGKYVYVAFKDLLFRFDPTVSGIPPINWLAFAPNRAHMYTAPAFSPDGKRLYVGAYDRTVYAFSPYENPPGVALSSWLAPKATDKFVGGALVYGDKVILGAGDKGLKAYNLQTGQEIPAFTGTNFGIWSTPVLDPTTNTLYVTSLDHHLYALDPNNLTTVKWEIDVGGAVGATPLLNNGILYVGTFNNELVAIDTATQKKIGAFKTQGWVWATPLLYDNVLYFGDMAGNIYAVDPSDLTKPLWTAIDTKNPEPRGIRGKMAIAKNKLVVGAENKFLTAYYIADVQNDSGSHKRGDQAWQQIVNDKILSDLLIVGNNVIYTTLADTDMVGAANLDNGAIQWRITRPPDEVLNSFASATPAPYVPPPTATATPIATAAATDVPR